MNELLIYFGSTYDEAREYHHALENTTAMSKYEWNGLHEAGDEDGTVWRAEFLVEDKDVKKIPTKLIQDTAKPFKLKVASISIYDPNDDKDPFDLFVDDNFVYCK